jgi:hypothetical protein
MLCKLKIAFFFTLFVLIFSSVQALPIKDARFLNQMQIEIDNTPDSKLTRLPPHTFTYYLDIPQDERADAPLQGSIYGRDSQTISIVRDDSNNNISNLKITDAVLGNRLIWMGKIFYNPNTQEFNYETTQEDSVHYEIIITLLPQKNDAAPQFKIEIYSI